MDEKTEAAPARGLEEAPAGFRPLAPVEPPGRPIWRAEELRGTDLRGQDLTQVEGLLPEHLAGADLTGAKLPDEIGKFPALDQVAAISSEARKIFIGLLAACVYSWLVIGTTTDVALILNTASSPLPIINTPIPIAGFYVVGAALLAAVYCYFHFYLLRLWRTLATLPAIFSDGVALDDKTDPWLLTNLVRIEFQHLRATAPPLARLENLLSIVLAWWLVPATLLMLWVRYLPAHDIGGLAWLALLIATAIFFGRQTLQSARATLRREILYVIPKSSHDQPQRLLVRILRDSRHLRPDQLIVWLLLPFFIIMALSLSALAQSPRNAAGEIVVFSFGEPWKSIQRVDKSLAKFSNLVGIRTYADLREVNLAERPDSWDGKDWSKIKRVDLRDRNLAFADATSTFLANADLRGANLTGAVLWEAQLQGADLYDDDAKKSAQLQGADLRHAWLQGADLTSAQLQGAYLNEAQLQGADLRDAELQGTDLRQTALWRASVHGAQWHYGDLRGANVQPMRDPDIEVLVTEATKSIPEEKSRKVVEERLTSALRTAERPARPAFPEEWRSKPNVMFDQNDPRPEPFDWGPPKWDTEEAYNKALATFLGNLACGREVPEAQTRGLARGALAAAEIPEWAGGGRSDRVWPRPFAARLIGPDCPPAKGLPEDLRRQLEQRAHGGDAVPAPAETSPPDSVE